MEGGCQTQGCHCGRGRVPELEAGLDALARAILPLKFQARLRYAFGTDVLHACHARHERMKRICMIF